MARKMKSRRSKGSKSVPEEGDLSALISAALASGYPSFHLRAGESPCWGKGSSEQLPPVDKAILRRAGLCSRPDAGELMRLIKTVTPTHVLRALSAELRRGPQTDRRSERTFKFAFGAECICVARVTAVPKRRGLDIFILPPAVHQHLPWA